MKQIDNILNERELYSRIGQNLRYYRKLYSIVNDDMTQAKLARLLNVSTSLIGNLESKKTNQRISLYNLYKISTILNISIDDFFNSL